MTSNPSAFISCDWGSTSFRLRVVERGTRQIIAEQATTNGIKSFATLPPAERATAMAAMLAERLAQWPDLSPEVPIAISGMASSNIGWRELAYANAPFPLDGSRCETESISFCDGHGQRRKALLISGVRTNDDIMRGEECALIGAHSLQPDSFRRDRSTLVLLAGTHPKHAVVTNSTLTSFRTHLTGELFAAITEASLLSASIDRGAAGTTPDLAQFRAGVAATRQHGFSGALFQVRARSVLENVSKAANTWFLSGLLVGAELERIAFNPHRPTILLVGEPLRVTLYREALHELAVTSAVAEAAMVDLGAAVIAGQEILLRHADVARAG